MHDSSQSTTSKSKLLLAGLGLLALSAAVVFNGISSRQSDDKQLQARVQAQSTPTVTLVSPTQASTAPPALELPGRIEAFARASLFARVSGYLKSWHVDIGSPVKAGQLLAEIETPDLDQQLLQAQAELGSAKANAALSSSTAKRWQSLQDQNFVSPQAVEEKLAESFAKLELAKASQANVARLQAMKNFTRIVAPFDGVVTARQTDVGALINVGGAPGSELFVVSDFKKLRLYVNVPQNYVTQIKLASTAQFKVPENPGHTYPAKVQSLSQSINAGSASMLIQLTADNAKTQLLPGGFANVLFEQPASDALMLPPSALIFGKDGLRVATVDAQNKVLFKSIKIARDFGSAVELASGLLPTDRVIENPPDGLLNGAVVNVSSKEK